MKTLKSAWVVFLIVVLTLTPMQTDFAAKGTGQGRNLKADIIRDSAEIRVAVSEDEMYRYTSTRWKKTNVLSAEQYNKKTKEVSAQTFHMNVALEDSRRMEATSTQGGSYCRGH